MPRSLPPKPLQVLLPALPPKLPEGADEDADAPRTDGPAPAPSLQVLLLAKEIAEKRGQVFDAESFMTKEQRAEYYTRILLRSPPPSPRPILKRERAPSMVDESARTPGSTAEDGHTPKKRMPNFANMHWRQRQKKMAEWAAAEAAAAAAAEAGESAQDGDAAAATDGAEGTPAAATPRGPSTPPHVDATPERKDEKKRKGDLNHVALREGASSVSYTHLTLPTTTSV